ncbi:hypothetical protein [Paracoccus salsus]|uniref:hypothetical protein n=1 Tax=Paracoccus salsus TaxID=2911061 RepID=UPI001F242567|nr:hypothetical protein [Paracoccus salsus]MCF3972376.1 hypothetical protein [Paracoccus salsus]
MSDLPIIDSEENLQVWLDTRPSVDAALVAHRAAMRVLPILLASLSEGLAPDWSSSALSVLRVNIASEVARKEKCFDVRKVAGNFDDFDSSDPAVDYVAYSALAALVADAAAAAAYAALAADGGPTSNLLSGATLDDFMNRAGWGTLLWKTVQADVHALIEGESLPDAALWINGNFLADLWQQSIPILQAAPGGDFWFGWYQRALDGRPQNLPLLRDVALIDNALWEQGGEALDTAITTLRRQHGLAATANAERIEPNPDTGRLRLVPDSQLPQEIAAYARRKISKATEVFDDYTGQAYGALAPDLAMLRRAVADAGNLPLELLDACASATRRLAIRIDNGDCPSATQDPLIADYQSRLREAGADILASDPEAQKVLARRAAIEGDRSLIDARQVIEETVATVAPVLEGRLADTLPLDAQTASDPDANPEDRAAASFRLAGRLLRIERALPFAADVRKGIVAVNAALLRGAKYLQAIEFFATLPAVKAAFAAIYRFFGL